ncbi:MAG: hypothetical protein H8E44_40025 [Planctomycetes bacterium]|nr:hypothetical protein [Planctomycetota bacterium]
MVAECRLLHTLELGAHTQFVGEILDDKADEAVLGEDGFPIMEKMRPMSFSPGANTYYGDGVGQLVGKAFSIGKGLM